MPNAQDAMQIAAWGWRVHPLYALTEQGVCTCPKGPACSSPGKHPRVQAWNKGATTDEEVISDWWDKWPKSNVAVVMGPTSGIIDLESDDEEAEQFILELFKGYEIVTPTFKSSRGTHRLFKFTGDLPNSDKAHWRLKSGLNLDFKIGNNDKGTYCVFPPSRHASGAVYQWVIHPDDCEPAEIPAEVIARLHVLATEGALSRSNREYPQSQWRTYVDTTVGEGNRNSAAASVIGGFLRSCEAGPQNPGAYLTVWNMAVGWNSTACNPPLSEDELRTVFDSISRRQARQQEESVSESVPPTTDEKSLEFLRKTLKLPQLIGVTKRGKKRATYELNFSNGDLLELGSIRDVLSISTVRQILLDSDFKVLIKRDNRNWPRVAQAIRDIAVDVETGDDTLFSHYLEEFFSSHQVRLQGVYRELEPGSLDWFGAVLREIRPLDVYCRGCFQSPDGISWLHQPAFQKFLWQVHSIRLSPEELCAKLRTCLKIRISSLRVVCS